MSATQYTVGEVVTAKHRGATWSGEIKAIGPQGWRPIHGKDTRKVTLAAQWKDLAGKEHVSAIEVPYCAITARLEDQGKQ